MFDVLITKMLTFTSNEFCSPKEIKYIERLVQTHSFRSIFLQRLNSLRVSGLFSWPQEHYVEVGKVMAMVLDAVQQENDLETAKNVIILSQTYYYQSNVEKIYLQKFIESHPLFRSKEFWEEFMLESIQKELVNNKKLDEKLNQNKNESNKKYKLKLSNIVLSQLVPIANNMLGFHFPKDGIIGILESVLNKYPINDSQKNIIFSVLENDLQYETKQLKEEEDIIQGKQDSNIIEYKQINKQLEEISINQNLNCIPSDNNKVIKPISIKELVNNTDDNYNGLVDENNRLNELNEDCKDISTAQ